MALRTARTQRTRIVTHVPHDALVRIDERVKDIVARRETSLRQALLAARRRRPA